MDTRATDQGRRCFEENGGELGRLADFDGGGRYSCQTDCQTDSNKRPLEFGTTRNRGCGLF
jgi:hypothetical protein